MAERVASRIVSRFLQRFVRTIEGEEVAAVRVVFQQGGVVLHNLDLNLSGAAEAVGSSPRVGSQAALHTQLSCLLAGQLLLNELSLRSCASLCRGRAWARTR